jgi:hypothetical protein
MNNKRILYQISWTQTYPGWDSFVDKHVESLLKYNNFQQALEVIAKIKSMS